MPDIVRELSGPWPSLVGSVEGLTDDLEREFRFCQSVIRIEGQYRLGGNLKGGSSAMWVPSDEDAYRTYLAWKTVDGIPAIRSTQGYDRLRRLLGRNGIELVNGMSPGDDESLRQSERRGYVFELLFSIISCLPPSHLRNPMFRKIQIGGWGPDAAKASAFEGKTVILYDFAVSGARRTLAGLVLHELGHACEAGMQVIRRSRLEKLFRTVSNPETLIGLDFLLDGSNRRAYQHRVFEEFLAETYLIYASCGRRIHEMVSGFPDAARGAWAEIYSIFREIFDCREYD